METIQFLLKFLFKLAIALIIASFVWWLVTALYPALSLRTFFLASGTENSWLPAPGSWGPLLGKQKVPSEYDNIYVPGPPYNGYSDVYNNPYGSGAQVDFITYTTTGVQITRNGQDITRDVSQGGQTGTSQGGVDRNGYASKELYIRNLSIYQGGSIYTGISFVGEARNVMFSNGKFPIIIVDNMGRVATVAIAEATSNWSVPGWARFQVKINGVMPVKTACTMVFQSGVPENYNQTPLRVAIPIVCN
ncbi:MAG: hypothetical protein WC444_01140 [Candidatus Paceibacterota bacterium]